MTNDRWIARRLIGLALSMSFVGCAVTDPTLYYSLGQTTVSAPTVRSADSGAVAAGSRGPVAATTPLSIGVGPVIIPGYLDRTQIVTRSGPDRVKLAAFHRWAEPLEGGIARIVADELGARVPTDRVVTFPWRGIVAQAIQYQVVIVVDRFDGSLDGDVTLDARWRVLGRKGDEVVFHRSTITEKIAGSGYDAMVAAMSRTLVALAEEITTDIRALPRSP